jgi:hypothetical protein
LRFAQTPMPMPTPTSTTCSSWQPSNQYVPYPTSSEVRPSAGFAGFQVRASEPLSSGVGSAEGFEIMLGNTVAQLGSSNVTIRPQRAQRMHNSLRCRTH